MKKKIHKMLTCPPGKGFVKSYFFGLFFSICRRKKKVLWNPADPPAWFVNFFSQNIVFLKRMASLIVEFAIIFTKNGEEVFTHRSLIWLQSIAGPQATAAVPQLINALTLGPPTTPAHRHMRRQHHATTQWRKLFLGAFSKSIFKILQEMHLQAGPM